MDDTNDSDEDRHNRDGEDDDDDDLQSHTIPPSPARLVVTNDGTLDKSMLKRVDGYMYKKGGAVNARGGFRNWKKRWFVLETVDFLGNQGFELQYFDAPHGKLKGKVNLNDVEVSKPASDSGAHQNKKVKHEFQLLLQSGGILQLSCDDEDEREEWIETLNTIVTFMRKVTTSSTMLLDGYDPACEDDEACYQIGEEIGANCQAFGPGLFGSEAGTPAQFVIQIHDLLGQPVNRGGMPITATIQDEDKTCLYYVAILENDEGLYYGHYTLGRCGKYTLSIKLNDEHHIFGSPFDLEIFPAKTMSKFCYAEGEALERVSALSRSTFTVQAMDGFGNKKVRGGDPFEVGVMGPARLIDLEDNADGTYTCTVEALPGAATAGNNSLMLMVSLYGRPIQGSPFKPVLTDYAMSAPFAPGQSLGAMGAPPAPASQSLASRSLSQGMAPPGTQSPAASVGGLSLASSARRGGPPPAPAPQYVPEYVPPPPPPATTASTVSVSPAANRANPGQMKVSDLAVTPANGPTSGTNSGPPLPYAQSQTGPVTAAMRERDREAERERERDGSQSQVSTMSRLERSRQRALLAKSLAEGQRTQDQSNGANNTANNNQPNGAGVAAPLPPPEQTATPREREIARPPELPQRQHRFAQGLAAQQERERENAAASSSSAAPGQPSLAAFGAGSAGGSKLSALAQRNAQLLQAKRQGIPIQPEVCLYITYICLIM